MRFSLSRLNLTQMAITLSCGTFLLLQAYAGYFSRYIADNYCDASIALSKGIIGSAAWWYNNWTGRFTFNLSIGVMGALGEKSVSIIPALILGVWFAAMLWTCYQIMQLIRAQRPFYNAILFNGIIQFAIFEGTPNIIQSLYWLVGSLTYTIPVIGLILTVGSVIYAIRQAQGGVTISPLILFAVGILTFVAGGTSEVYALMQTVILVFILLGLVMAHWSSIWRHLILLFGVGIVGSCLALIIMLSAPGNAIRQTTLIPPLTMPQLLSKTLVATAAFIATDVAIFAPIALIFTLILSLFFVQQLEIPLTLPPSRVRSLLGISLAIALALIVTCIAPPLYAYAKDSIPPDRVLFLPHVVLIVTAAFWGCVMGLRLKRNPSSATSTLPWPVCAVVIVMIVVGPLISTGKLVNQITDYRIYAAESDNRDQTIKNAVASGVQDVKVSQLSVDMAYLGGLDIIGADPNQWVNVCAANYYAAKTITANPG